MSAFSIEKVNQDDYPEFAVKRGEFANHFQPPLPKSTFFDLVNRGKILPVPGLRGYYRLNASLRRLGMPDTLRLAPGEDSCAWKRRLIILQTRAADPQKLVVNLADRILAEERDAVFSKLLHGAYAAASDLAKFGMLQVPSELQLGGSDAVLLLGDVTLWVSEAVSEGESAFATRDLYLVYSRWSATRGETPVSESVFGRQLARLMEERGHESTHSVRSHGEECNGYRKLEVRA